MIVTGGASGLGEATAVKYAQNGAYVTIADVDEERGQALSKKLSAEGGKASFAYCDTAQWESCVAAFKHAVDFAPTKTLDVAVLFAGIGGARTSLVDEVVKNDSEPSLEKDPIKPVHTAIDVNLIGVHYCAYLALHYFRLPSTTQEQSSTFKKCLVLVSSIMGYIDPSYNTDYGAAKYGVRGIFRSLRSEVQKLDCRVNSIAPGFILTPLTKRVHGIEEPRQPSKITGLVMPWAPTEYVTEAVGMSVCDQSCNGTSASCSESRYSTDRLNRPRIHDIIIRNLRH